MRRLRDFGDGVRILATGFGLWRRSPRIMAIGLVPGLITAIALGAVFVGIAVWVDDWSTSIAGAVTGDPSPNRAIVALFAIAIIGGAVLLSVYAFTAITLLIGQPFFEAIADAVAESIGFVALVDEEPWWRSTLRGLGDGVRLLLFAGAFGAAMFLVGLVPVVGTATAFTIGTFVGGALLSLELTAYPLARAGVFSLRDRRRVVRSRRPLSLGFGAAAYLVCLVPLGAVLSMPALVAGGTVLAQRLTATADHEVEVSN